MTIPAPVYYWDYGVHIDEKAHQQIHNVSKLPFIFPHIAVMPDAHWGMGSTVGSVIPTQGAIIPAAVGVDIGCGMQAVRTTLTADHVSYWNLPALRSRLEAAIPHGRSHHGDPALDRGAHREAQLLPHHLGTAIANIQDLHPKLTRALARAPFQIGTLGTGNHFIELCYDEVQTVWIVLHSGSRGMGNAIGTYFTDLAKEQCRGWCIDLPDPDLAYLPTVSPLFQQYITALFVAQRYARHNRDAMMNVLTSTLFSLTPGRVEERIDCHHNYTAAEQHYGQHVWVTRKGAVRATVEDLGIIPGSMGTRSYIVRGKGNTRSLHSCSHGAGRSMSRGEAKKRISIEDHAKATMGIECRQDVDVLDESPAAYKNIDHVMTAQHELVDILHTLRQFICIKG